MIFLDIDTQLEYNDYMLCYYICFVPESTWSASRFPPIRVLVVIPSFAILPLHSIRKCLKRSYAVVLNDEFRLMTSAG